MPPSDNPRTLTLVSHALCPYVQRAAIALLEKGVPFERRWIDLAAKPDWFLAVSPLGRTPVLLVDGAPLFESAAICEYLDETQAPRLHPDEPLQRARHRAWMEVGSGLLNALWTYETARDEAQLAAARADLLARFAPLEAALDADGPFFAGARFSLVDAVLAPVFRYFAVFEALGEGGWFDATPRLARWRAALLARPSVRDAVPAGYDARLRAFLLARDGALARRIARQDSRTGGVRQNAGSSGSGTAASARAGTAR